jgi:rhodanese-related sulfurtransferase
MPSCPRALLLFPLIPSPPHTLFLILLLIGFPSAFGGNIHKNISVHQADTLIRNHDGKPDFVILDVRTPGEYSAGYIRGAKNIDFWSDGFAESIVRLDRHAIYLVYCTSGVRSSGAIKKMRREGFTRLYNLKSGMIGWRAAGMPVVKKLP